MKKNNPICLFFIAFIYAIPFFFLPEISVAQEANLPAELPQQPDMKGLEISFIFNTLLFIFSSLLALFMLAGFTLLESGAVKQEYLGGVLVKNLCGYAICGVMFFLCGYHLMFTGVESGWHGIFFIWAPEARNIISAESFTTPFASASDWFFQMMLAAMPALIISGILGIRIKHVSYLLFCIPLAGIMYPLAGSWLWGGGWLREMGFFDFAGASIIHSLAGWCALTAVILLGPRKGRFESVQKARPHRNIGYIALGTIFLWISWLAYMGGSQLGISSAADAADVSNIIVNANLAACGGILAAYVLHLVIYRKSHNTALVLSGALAGLVSISAEPLLPSPGIALLIGAVGGVLVIAFSELLRLAKIDDASGGIPVHLGAGIWGTLAVPLTNPQALFIDQLIGIMVIAGFAITVSLGLWVLIGVTVGLRIKNEHELLHYS